MNPKDDPSGGRLVYSTTGGRVRDKRGPDAAEAPEGDGVVRVRAEKKGRRGKVVTTVSGVPLKKSALKTLAKELRKDCGTGGTVKNGVIEIQGDFVDVLIAGLRRAVICPSMVVRSILGTTDRNANTVVMSTPLDAGTEVVPPDLRMFQDQMKNKQQQQEP